MSSELKRHNSFQEISSRTLPSLPILDTQELIENMQYGSWRIPSEPYTTLDRIDENDLDFIKDHKRETFRVEMEEIISDWIPFLDNASEGFRITERIIKERIVKVDLRSTEAFVFFCDAFDSRFPVGEKRDYEGAISSVRNAFLYLLPKERVEELGHEKPKTIFGRDIENAKFLVEAFVKNLYFHSFVKKLYLHL